MSGNIEKILRRGIKMQNAGDVKDAAKAFSKVLRVAPDNPDVLRLYGSACGQAGCIEKALTALKRAAELAPNSADIQFSLGVVLFQTDALEKAELHFQRAIHFNPDMGRAYAALGNLYKQQKNTTQAIGCYKAAIQLVPTDVNSWNNLGSVYVENRDVHEAEFCLHRALEIQPNCAPALLNLDILYVDQERPEDVIGFYEKALQVDEKNIDVWLRYAHALDYIGRIEQAHAVYQKIVTEVAPHSGEAWSMLANAEFALGHIERAGECHDKAIKCAPDSAWAHFRRALYRLTIGDLERGFDEYEWGLRGDIRKTADDDMDRPRWDGQPFAGQTLLVRAEQGLGDTFQFLRCMPQVKALGGRVLLEVQHGLGALLADVEGVDEVIDRREDKRVLQPFDQYVWLLSLPTLLGVTLDNCTPQMPYLSIPEPFRANAQDIVAGDIGFKVLLTWYGDAEHANDRNRSCDLTTLKPLFNIPRVSWYTVSPGERTRRDIDAVGAPINALSLSINDAAAVIDTMDLVIAVDTAHVHIAGALGKPVWALIPYRPDWRWLLEREDSPWYPHMRLFRQAQRGDWAEVVVRLKAALLEAVA